MSPLLANRHLRGSITGTNINNRYESVDPMVSTPIGSTLNTMVVRG